jgi:hypothetical protein
MINKERLKLDADTSGETIWVCSHCGQPADHANGVQNNPDQLVLMLMCPSGKVTLGEWATEEEKTVQLAAYARELRLAQITRELVNNGLHRTSLKQEIAQCQGRALRETDPPRKVSIERECESLKNREIALGTVARDLKEERERLIQGG